MAFTKANAAVSVFGNKRVAHFLLTTDAVSGVVDTGLGRIEAVVFSAKSMTSDATMKANELTAATASNGKLHVVNCTSGDDIYVVCIGV